MPVIEILLLVGLVVFITHTLEAVTGFGCTVLAFPFVIALMGDLEIAKIVLSVLAWALALYFVITKYKQIQWNQFGIIVLLAGLGMPAGMLLFRNLDAAILKKALGVFILLSAAIQLYKSFVPATGTRSLPKWLGYMFLLSGGIVHGAFAIGGPLIVLYSSNKIPDKGQFRATMCLLWAILNTVLMVQYVLEKKLTPAIGYELLFLLPFLVAGIFAGEVIHKRVSEILFKKVVFSSLLLVGITMII
ncbi:MAG: sulfite exporter TauE/SafE family protein [Dysgonamonadaceae bacterium]|jgi:uncharacterized membrane protein YfcA|nr:sulfite exporter TauE/SafE family protein [Dysgonamonadaceae bacterium]